MLTIVSMPFLFVFQCWCVVFSNICFCLCLMNMRDWSMMDMRARAFPIGLKSMQNSTFLVLLRPIFAPKIKTAPPTEFGSKSWEGFPVIWTRIVVFFGSGAHPKSVKTFFLFWRSPDVGRQNSLNCGEDLFFFLWRGGEHLILTEKPPQYNSRLMKIWVKFDYGWIKLQKKPPPPFAKSWLRDCYSMYNLSLFNF